MLVLSVHAMLLVAAAAIAAAQCAAEPWLLEAAALPAGVCIAGHLLDEVVQYHDHLLKVGPPLGVGVPAPRHHLLQRLHRKMQVSAPHVLQAHAALL